MPLSTILQLYCGGQFIGGGNRSTVASHWQILSHNVVSSTLHHENGIWTHNVSGDRHWLHR